MTGQLLISELVQRYAQSGRVEWIGIRPARKAPLTAVARVDVSESGLADDHRVKPGKRAVTLIQAEHLTVMASYLGCEAILPAQLRRNIVVSGINLLGLRNRTFRIGDVVLQGSGLCAPCSRMETELGHGGYAAVRGHGGICASVVTPGSIAIGNAVEPFDT